MHTDGDVIVVSPHLKHCRSPLAATIALDARLLRKLRSGEFHGWKYSNFLRNSISQFRLAAVPEPQVDNTRHSVVTAETRGCAPSSHHAFGSQQRCRLR